MRLLAFVLLAILTATSYGQSATRILVPFPAGAGTDAAARIVAPKLGERIGHTVIVENRPGAGGIIAVSQTAKAEPDGSTLVLATANTLTSNVALYKEKLPYVPLKDVVPVSRLGNVPMILVANASLPAKTAADVVRLAKAQPGKLTFGSAGNGTFFHLAGELFKALTDTEIVHVPYKGIAPSVTAVAAGDTSLAIADLTATRGPVQAGRVKLIGVLSKSRSPLAPDLPTIAESGAPGMDAVGWFAIMAPGGTPPATIARLNKEIVGVLAQPDVREAMLKVGVEPQSSSVAELTQLIKEETAKWADVVKRSGAKID